MSSLTLGRPRQHRMGTALPRTMLPLVLLAAILAIASVVRAAEVAEDAASTTHGVVPVPGSTLGPGGDISSCPAGSQAFFDPAMTGFESGVSTSQTYALDSADGANTDVTLLVMTNADYSLDFAAVGGSVTAVVVADAVGYVQFEYADGVTSDTAIHGAGIAASGAAYQTPDHLEFCLAAEALPEATTTTTTVPAETTTTTTPEATSSTETTGTTGTTAPTTTAAPDAPADPTPETGDTSIDTEAPSGTSPGPAASSEPTPETIEPGGEVVDHNGAVWAVGLKPDGSALVRRQDPNGTWSDWMQQGSAGWASLSVSTDRAGNVWIVGVKESGVAYVRTKDDSQPLREGWSSWMRQGTGDWAAMSMTLDNGGDVWLIGVKDTGTAYVRTKDAAQSFNRGWSSWVHQGSKDWRSVAIATDTTGNLWLVGVTDHGVGYARMRAVGENVGSGWSQWVRQGGNDDWVSMNLATDSADGLWIVGVKDTGTAYLRMKVADPKVHKGWTSFQQLGSADSWASMTLTIDDADTLWLAGVKFSGTGFVRMRCACEDFYDGWTPWMQQGMVNSWNSLSISTDPSNRVALTGTKLSGVAYTRTKNVEFGIWNGWGGWVQHGGGGTWRELGLHSNAWTGNPVLRTPSLTIADVYGQNVHGTTTDPASTNGAYAC